MSIAIQENICRIGAAKPYQNVFYILLELTQQQVVYPLSTLVSIVSLGIFHFKVLKNVWIVVLENIKQILGHQQSLTVNFVGIESIRKRQMHPHFQNALLAMLAGSALLDAVCA